jgi:PAT family beta-lactamase induction signal transducer AmpG
MIVSGGMALIWTDAAQGGGWTWPRSTADGRLMVAAAVLSALLLPRLPAGRGAAPRRPRRTRPARGFVAVLAAVAVGVLLTDRVGAAGAPLGAAGGTTLPARCSQRWVDLAALLAASPSRCRWPPGRRGARASRPCWRACASYFSQPGAAAFLVLIVLYKLGDAFAGSLLTPFLLKSMAFAPAEVGVVNKVIGLWLTIGGALLGGALMLKLGLWRSLLLFGVLQMASNLGFWWLAVRARAC